MPNIWTLGGGNTRKEFEYTGSVRAGVKLLFKATTPVSASFLRAILEEFAGRRIPGGFNMMKPTPGGLGEWVQENSPHLNTIQLTPKHASFIAAILVHEGCATSSLKGNAVYLQFASEKPGLA